MANKKSVEQRKRSAREEALLAGRKKLRVFPLVSLVMALVFAEPFQLPTVSEIKQLIVHVRE